jgi:hypothetical protein
MIRSFSRTVLFWMVFSIISAGCVWFTLRYFSKAMPIANISIAMSRTQALEKAQTLAHELHIGPDHSFTAAAFDSDNTVQTFVELEAGGSDAFNAMITGTLFSPFTWQARLFKENEPHEATFVFKPDGTAYGFEETIAEKTDGASLTPDQARPIAEQNAHNHWNINFADYQLIESSQEKKPNGRIDHQFTYERPGISVGTEGKYRLKLTITGDKLTRVKHFIKIPEGFFRRFSEIRSVNDTISQLAVFAFWILYLIIGCYVGFLILAREKRLLLRQALWCALFLALLQAAPALNDLPQAWMRYNTAMSSRNFLFDYFVDIITGFLRTFVMILIPAAAVAEALTRKAFGNHIQFWRTLTYPTAGSLPVFGRVMGGLVMPAVDLALLTLTYIIARTYFGWWMPSDPMVDPNILASYFPWISAATRSLYAGFWEELVFRAVPLAGAALIGDRFGKRNLFLGIGMVVQAIIFGAAHANYPMLPGYARVVELILPSLIFGFLYLRFGLLVPIISHATYDLILMGLPLFMTSAPGAWVNQTFLILWGLIPLFMVLWSYVRTKHWYKLPHEAYNSAWHPTPHQEQNSFTSHHASTHVSLHTALILFMLAIGGFAVTLRFTSDEPPLTITRTQAEQHATQVLAQHNTTLLPEWKTFAQVDGSADAYDYFTWTTGKKAAYTELIQNRFLTPPAWIIRCAKFTGDLQERAEEFLITLDGSGKAIKFVHKLPEIRNGVTLTEAVARKKAHEIITSQFGLTQFEEVSAHSDKHPNRTDWSFVFSVPQHCPLPEGQARIGIVIAGDTLTTYHKYLHAPEEWKRTYKNEKTFFASIEQLGKALLSILLLSVVLYALSTLQSSWSTFWRMFLFIFTLGIVVLINKAPLLSYQLSTSQPVTSQMIVLIAGELVQLLLQASISSVVIGLVATQWHSIAISASSALIAIATGIGAAIIPHALRYLSILGNIPALYPTPWWASYAGADTALPWLGVSTGMITAFISVCTSLFALLTLVRLLNKHHQLLGLLLILIYSFAMVGAPESLPFWGLQGLLLTVLLIIAYLLIADAAATVIPVGVASYLGCKALQLIILHAFPGAVAGYVVGIAIITLIMWLTFRFFHKK